MLPHARPLASDHQLILKVFFDSESTKTLIHKSAFPQNFQCIPNVASLSFQTLTTFSKAFALDHICFPEFNSNISSDSHIAYVFDPNCWYDVIFGADFLDKVGFTTIYDNHTMKWVDHIITLNDPQEFFGPNILTTLNDQLFQNKEGEIFERDLLDNYSTRILDSKYKQVDMNQVAAFLTSHTKPAS